MAVIPRATFVLDVRLVLSKPITFIFGVPVLDWD